MHKTIQQTKRPILVVLSTLLMLTVVLPLFAPARVEAISSVNPRFINKHKVSVKVQFDDRNGPTEDIMLTDVEPFDDNDNWRGGTDSKCRHELKYTSSNENINDGMTFYYRANDGSGNCIYYGTNGERSSSRIGIRIPSSVIWDQEKRKINAYRVDADNLFVVATFGFECKTENEPSIFTRKASGIRDRDSRYFMNTPDADQLLNNDVYVDTSSPNSGKVTTGTFNCSSSKRGTDLVISNDRVPDLYGFNPEDVLDLENPDSSAPDGVNVDTCESETGSSFGWLICPVIHLGQKTLDWIYTELLNPVLNFNIGNEGEGRLEEVWSGFRMVANLLFVIMFIVIIYSAATGNVMSAYDVRKLLPRLFIVAILVQLSFFLSTLALTVSNVVGSGVQSLMLFPLSGSESLINVGGIPDYEGPGGRVVNLIGDTFDLLAGLGGGIALAVALLVLLFYCLIGAIMLAAVLIVRSVGIVMLIVVSPVAFALNLLPGTEKYFKMWWKWFFGLLAVFPILMAFLASGKLAAAVFTDSNVFVWPIGFIVSTAALFLPYYFALKILKFAGAASGALNGVLNSVSSGKDKLFGKSGAIRGSEGYKRFQTRAKGGEAFKPGGRLGRLNSTARLASAPGSFLPTRGAKRSRIRAEAALGSLNEDEKKLDARNIADEVADITGSVTAPDGKVVSEGDRRTQYLRDVASNTSESKSRRMAALDRMVMNNDFEGTRMLAEQMDAGGRDEQRFWHETMKQQHASTLGSKAPHLLKTDPGTAQNAAGVMGNLGAKDISGMHKNAVKDALQLTAKQAQTATDPAKRAEAEAAIASVFSKYTDALNSSVDRNSLAPSVTSVLDSTPAAGSDLDLLIQSTPSLQHAQAELSNAVVNGPTT